MGGGVKDYDSKRKQHSSYIAIINISESKTKRKKLLDRTKAARTTTTSEQERRQNSAASTTVTSETGIQKEKTTASTAAN